MHAAVQAHAALPSRPAHPSTRTAAAPSQACRDDRMHADVQAHSALLSRPAQSSVRADGPSTRDGPRRVCHTHPYCAGTGLGTVVDPCGQPTRLVAGPPLGVPALTRGAVPWQKHGQRQAAAADKLRHDSCHAAECDLPAHVVLALLSARRQLPMISKKQCRQPSVHWQGHSTPPPKDEKKDCSNP
jgi:hypothetical protein